MVLIKHPFTFGHIPAKTQQSAGYQQVAKCVHHLLCPFPVSAFKAVLGILPTTDWMTGSNYLFFVQLGIIA